MFEYRLSKRASKDLAIIADYTISEFGIEQARRYKEGFSACFSNLADHPELGRKADELAEGLRRFKYESHVVFYVVKKLGILIVRILHEKMAPERHL